MRARNKNPNKTVVGKVLGYVSTALIAAAFIVVVAVLISAFVAIGKGQTPSVFGYRFYTVLTDSMTPTIEVGDVIISKEVTEKSIKGIQTGDIITYVAESGEMSGKTVTHRVIEGIHYDESVGAEVVLTRGDKAGAAVDAPVRLDQIQSVMIRKSAGLKKLYSLFRSGAGFAIVIILPLAVMLVTLVVRLVQAIRAPQSDTETVSGSNAREAEQAARVEEIKMKAIEEYLAMSGEGRVEAGGEREEGADEAAASGAPQEGDRK